MSEEFLARCLADGRGEVLRMLGGQRCGPVGTEGTGPICRVTVPALYRQPISGPLIGQQHILESPDEASET